MKNYISPHQELLLIVGFTLCFSPVMCQQTMGAEQIVQQQLDAYNQRDIDGFMDLFGEEATLVNQSDGKVLGQGKPEVRELYTNLFEQSLVLHSTLKNRMVLGNTVIDHESITFPVKVVMMGHTADLQFLNRLHQRDAERQVHRNR